jgi:hypothetical protein
MILAPLWSGYSGFKQAAKLGQAVIYTRQTQGMPAQGHVARKNRFAQFIFNFLNNAESPHIRAGNKDYVNVIILTQSQDNLFDGVRCYEADIIIQRFIPRAHNRDRKATFLDKTAHLAIDIIRVGRYQGYAAGG